MEKEQNKRTSLEEQLEQFRLSEDEIRNAFASVNSRGDQIIGFALALYFVLGFVFAPSHNTWLEALVFGAISFFSFLILRIATSHLNIHRYVGSLAMGIFAALFIYELRGQAEAHYFTIAGGMLLVIYQNWRFQLPYLIVVVISQITIAILQVNEMESWTLIETASGTLAFRQFAFHLAVITILILLTIYWGNILRKTTMESHRKVVFGQVQTQYVEQNIDFAHRIAQDDAANIDIEVREDDLLGNALVHMHKGLEEARIKEEQEKFVNVGLAKIGEILREIAGDFEKGSARLISELVKYFDANQGGLFVLETEENGDEYLNLVAFYAYERVKYAREQIIKGEGLIGQAWLEESSIHLTEIPQGYIRVTSGLGDATPESLLIVPMLVNDKVYAIIELASFSQFDKYQIEFMEKLGQSIAATISNYKTNAYTKRLLMESRELTEQMGAQEEEMRQNMEELQATQEELARKDRIQSEELEKMKRAHEERLKEVERSREEMESALTEFQEYAEIQMNEKMELETEFEQLKEKLSKLEGGSAS